MELLHVRVVKGSVMCDIDYVMLSDGRVKLISNELIDMDTDFCEG